MTVKTSAKIGVKENWSNYPFAHFAYYWLWGFIMVVGTAILESCWK